MGDKFDILDDFFFKFLSISFALSNENLVFLLLTGDHFKVQRKWRVITFALILVKVGLFRPFDGREEPHCKAQLLLCFLITGGFSPYV